VDAGETCDTAIAAGQPGACPTSCNDGDQCTTDALTNPGTCTAACTFAPVTMCQTGDGCCPSGCTGGSDGDCSLCGNGLVDFGETCDLGIPSGMPGSCPTSCDDRDACTTDTLQLAGTCQALCKNAPVTMCQGGDGCCPAGCTFDTDSDCGGPDCGNGV